MTSIITAKVASGRATKMPKPNPTELLQNQDVTNPPAHEARE